MNYIAKETNMTPAFISKMLPYLAVTVRNLPRVLYFDEFKGNSGS